MPSVGPSLPPQFQKRKHKINEDSTSSSDSDAGPQPQRSPDEVPKRRKVMGPAMPPAPLDERPAEDRIPENNDDTSSDDGYGPALPKGPSVEAGGRTEKEDVEGSSALEQDMGQPQRDSWMLAPPSQNDLTSRMDPSKLRARKFNSGKGARGGAAGNEVDQIWTETPEQKAKRLRDEMMGVSKPKTGVDAARSTDTKEARETARRIQEHNEKNRSKSLFDQPQKSSKAEDDDPSGRKFDYAKDVGGGVRLGAAQKKEMLSRAKDFGSKFSGGNYL